MLLHITASPRSEDSISRRVARDFIQRLWGVAPALRIVERDLSAAPLPAPDTAFARASLTPELSRDDADRSALSLSESLIAELEAASALLIATPMHNYTVPATLKAWIDHVVRPGRTFRSTPAGKVGLLEDRPVLVMMTCGGSFGDVPGRQPDFLTPYLKAIFATIGLTTFHSIRLENCARGEDYITSALNQAHAWSETQTRSLAEQLAAMPDAKRKE